MNIIDGKAVSVSVKNQVKLECEEPVSYTHLTLPTKA